MISRDQPGSGRTEFGEEGEDVGQWHILAKNDEVFFVVAVGEVTAGADEERAVGPFQFGGCAIWFGTGIAGTHDHPDFFAGDELRDDLLGEFVAGEDVGHGGFGPDQKVRRFFEGSAGKVDEFEEAIGFFVCIPNGRLWDGGLNEGDFDGFGICGRCC